MRSAAISVKVHPPRKKTRVVETWSLGSRLAAAADVAVEEETPPSILWISSKVAPGRTFHERVRCQRLVSHDKNEMDETHYSKCPRSPSTPRSDVPSELSSLPPLNLYLPPLHHHSHSTTLAHLAPLPSARRIAQASHSAAHNPSRRTRCRHLASRRRRRRIGEEPCGARGRAIWR